ncbi:energy transducer TonB [Sulfuricurvum sp. RIFOXYD2_FULL_44_160]|uniref:energy transducer TonB n=1 Tax=Sulfuricurvum sp. RIFOXYD2_FULL_44_160 TaxID=1802249 RepID=UPI000A5C105D|nr:energy transducer TonB [Sulfuricurvum sp. RIFOXYD2_FULL_44_160]
MRAPHPFLLSVGIHLTLAALIIGAVSVIHKTLPVITETTSLKVLIHTPESVLSIPIKSPEPIQKKEEPIPLPKQIQTSTPIKTPVLVQSKPIPVAPQTAPTITPSVKTPEITAQAVPKAPPPPPKVEENYAEENLGRIRTILAERLKYPKNALRLKQQGGTIVTFTLDTNRDVSQITITQSSGFELLDDAAKNLIESSANLFPKPAKSVRISVPIAYKLR